MKKNKKLEKLEKYKYLKCACGNPQRFLVPDSVERVICDFCVMGIDWRRTTVNPRYVFKDKPSKPLSKDWYCAVRKERVKSCRTHCKTCPYKSKECIAHLKIYLDRLERAEQRKKLRKLKRRKT